MALKLKILPISSNDALLKPHQQMCLSVNDISLTEINFKKIKESLSNSQSDIDLSRVNQCEVQFISKLINDSRFVMNDNVRESLKIKIDKRDQEMIQGKIFNGSFVYEDVIHQITIGVLNIGYTEFLQLMPTHTWGINQPNYKGGAIKAISFDSKGLVTEQRERMRYRTSFLKTIDKTLLETIRYGDTETIVQWEIVESHDGSLIKEIGALHFIARKDGKVQIEFESEYRLDRNFYLRVISKQLQDQYVKTIRHWQKIADGKVDPITSEDIYGLKVIWENWSGNIKNFSGKIVKPKDSIELERYVQEAVQKKQKIRVVGAGHSWSPITKLDEGLLLNLDNIKNILKIDKEKMQVKVEAGIRLYDLNEKLSKEGIALPILGTINKQSLAGVISTSTHGTGINFGTISNLVVELEIIDGTGKTHVCSATKEPELFLAARCALGTLGIIKTVTLQCVPKFNLKHEQKICTVDELFASLEKLIADNEYFKFWWVPHTGIIVIISWSRTTEAINRGRFSYWFNNEFLQNSMPSLFLWITALFPQATRSINKMLGVLAPKYNSFVDRSDKVLNIPINVIHNEAEYAIPRENVAQAFKKIMDLVEAQNFNVAYPLVEVRFVKGDNILLSPAYGRESSYIGIYQSPHLPKIKYFRAVEKIMDEYQGRPHWGKIHFKKFEDIKLLYPELDRFLVVREKMDPNNLFMNCYLNKLLLGDKSVKDANRKVA